MIKIDRLKEIRQDKDLSQNDIAKLLKMTQVQYSRYERGVRSIPVEKLAILASYYNVSIDYLLGITNERKPYPKINI